MRRRFFVEQFDSGTAVLRGEAARHLDRVLRAKPGQLYELSDGYSIWLARAERVDRDEVEFALVEQMPAREPLLDVTLLLAVVKFDRFEWAIEKATELGVSTIVPLAAARSEKALLKAAPKRAERWRRILVESAQQARRLRMPALGGLMQVAEAFSQTDGAAKLMLSEKPGSPRLRAILNHRRDEKRDLGGGGGRQMVALAIGPEGGWTEAEFEAAHAGGFMEASLGDNILRTETAVAAGLAIVQYALGD